MHVHVLIRNLMGSFFLQNQTLQLNLDTIYSIKRGVEFGRMLQLPDNVSFHSEHMADILTAGGSVRPFNQIK